MKNLSISFKIWILVTAVTLFSFVVGIFGYNALNNVGSLAVEQTGAVMMEGHRDKLKALTDGMAITLGEAIQSLDSKEEQIEHLRTLNTPVAFYPDKSGYFMIYTTQGLLVSLPPKRALEGKDLIDLKDENGVYIIRDLVKAAKSGGDFSEYVWPKPGSEVSQPKLSYATLIPGTDFLVGTGIYVDDVDARKAELYAEINHTTSQALWWGLGTVVVCFVVIILPLVFVLLRQIVRPLVALKGVANQIADGDMAVDIDHSSGDEVGELAKSLKLMAANLKQHADLAAEIAEGNFAVDVHLASERDQFGTSMKAMVHQLTDLIAQIRAGGDQISSASSQVADSSQTLSQGATETAASLEEISSSINEMASQTRHSADSANTASQLSSEASKAAASGGEKMRAMVAAMNEINDAGQNINKIIKTIDEIAFQTNLLALNAAVEAARAGQHGKGFAVVAEEVRNLAARSAKAASETAELIEGSVAKTENGTEMAQQTSAALEEIVEGITKVTDLVAEIAAASNEQAQGISQINQGLGQIDEGVQQNTATAEESAAAAEQLSAQAAHLKQLLSRFKLAGQAQAFVEPAPQPQYQPTVSAAKPSSTSSSGWGGSQATAQISLDDDEFGRF
ncbi:cache domain-containing protein [Desulfuromonas acetoxidans]|uniref:Methyl-accepting chemotaxis sensory transducer n=1 Tax=Desulfuromonas acetoxidans (strain DSM 684 / 11070) TaxID=281689 RepID=Q1JZ02_DESA6|nr:methyl-accepting chemotaxis protein [Desulfuromonas acetoxidans]EAT15492.1 methyl-accepting chemotaxis sensory transducer [Desulfuromonas acetoxidans DSM 684]MBF0646678.1 cache domain-containing protein [Desulfuromonas acetoxidans]NVD25781.1 cache domain-containing protein [Desulfuromonas acetoxidans]NVE17759.1 cache domain-containing protein [Desulfuromonas acetoxidans]